MIRKHIPNTITSMNLLSGAVGVIFALAGRVDIAFYLMIAAGVFDFCDGLTARLLGAYSPIGKELDSLADLVSFGLLPAVMLCAAMFASNGFVWYAFIPLFLTVMSALRLAKFNIDERQSENFIGLATPSAALISASLVCFADATPDGFLARACATVWCIPVVAVILGLLLVSEIPFFGMKIKKGGKLLDSRRVIFLSAAVAIVLTVAILRLHWSLAILLIFLFYLFENIILNLVCKNL